MEGKTRIKASLGQCFHNKGTSLTLNTEKYIVDRTREFYLFDVIPIGAPRMTRSDKWKTNPNHVDPLKRQRKPVTQYFEFKNTLTKQAKILNYELGNYIDCVFFICMPDSWSEKKKIKMNGMPHKTKPDTDNIIKGVKDTLLEQDSIVWWEKAEKRWAYKGSILIYK